MNTTVRAACAACLATVIASSCAGPGGTGAGNEKRAASPVKERRCALQGSGRDCEYRCGSMNVIAPRESFDTADLGRGYDSLYGRERPGHGRERVREWDDRLPGAFGQWEPADRRCRREGTPDYEDAMSEQHTPPVDSEAYYPE